MQLLIPIDVVRRMRRHMFRASSREIGGMLMGEELGEQRFRIVDFSIDAESGTSAHFVRDADQHDQALAAFFRKTGAEYGRFNYLGEWHTHPNFDVQPSVQDVHAMRDLVDGSGGVEFAALLIARLGWFWRYECSAHLFMRNYPPTEVEIIRESAATAIWGMSKC
jgi:integrative and conjugative element protein (TIGR02256 family)